LVQAAAQGKLRWIGYLSSTGTLRTHALSDFDKRDDFDTVLLELESDSFLEALWKLHDFSWVLILIYLHSLSL
jgi:tRNA (Thr-GGU) A37 N-methylase